MARFRRQLSLTTYSPKRSTASRPAGHDAAVDLLDRIEENARFHIDSLNTDAFATGKALFRQHEPRPPFVDACIIAYTQTAATERNRRGNGISTPATRLMAFGRQGVNRRA